MLIRLFCTIFFVALFSVPFGAIAQEQASESTTAEAEVTAPSQAVSVEPVARDDEIARRILEIMRATGWYSGADVNVTDGIVFLDGRAASEDHKLWARDLATKTQDVVAVVNRISVVSEVKWSFAPALREMSGLARQALTSLPLVLFAFIILPLTWWLSTQAAKLARRWILGGINSPFLKDILARTLALPIFLIGLYIVLQLAGLTQVAFSVVGGAGVLGIVAGFAFRDIAENFLASLLLSIRRPFRSGDYIEVADMGGTVRSMNTRSTVLISPEGNHIQIPNSAIFKSTIVNYSASPNRRDTLAVGVGYDVSIAEAQTLILEVISAHEATLKEPEPMILVDTLGSSTVNIKAYYWMNAQDYSILKVRSALLRQVTNKLTEAGISMPDDAREVIFPQGVPVLQLDGAAEASARSLAQIELAETNADQRKKTSTEKDVAVEGDLANETAEVAKLTAETELDDEATDLLSDEG